MQVEGGMQALPHAQLVSDFGSNWISVDLLQNYSGSWNAEQSHPIRAPLEAAEHCVSSCEERPWLRWLTPHNPAQELATRESTCDEIPSKVIRGKDMLQVSRRRVKTKSSSTNLKSLRKFQM